MYQKRIKLLLLGRYYFFTNILIKYKKRRFCFIYQENESIKQAKSEGEESNDAGFELYQPRLWKRITKRIIRDRSSFLTNPGIISESKYWKDFEVITIIIIKSKPENYIAMLTEVAENESAANVPCEKLQINLLNDRAKTTTFIMYSE